MKLPPFRLTMSSALHCTFGAAIFTCVSVVNIPATVIKEFIKATFASRYHIYLSTTQLAWAWSAVIAAVDLGAILAALPARLLLQKIGRRTTIMVFNSWIIIFASMLQFFCKTYNSFELLIIGRLFSGVGLSFALFIPMYLSECSPVYCRGWTGSSYMCGRSVWYLVGYTLSMPQLLGTDDLWPYLLALPAVPATIYMLLSCSLPKSPTYLYVHKKDQQKSADAISFYHGADTDIDQVFSNLDEEAKQAANEKGLMDMLRTTHLRRALFISVAGSVIPILCGSDILMSFTSQIFEQIGLDKLSANLAIVLTAIPSVLFTVLSLYLVERLGRRWVINGCQMMGIVTMILFILSYIVPVGTWRYVIAFSALILACLATSLVRGAVALLPTEIVPQECRAIVKAITIVTKWFPSMIVNLCFLIVELSIGPGVFVPFLVCGIIVLVYMYRNLPEPTNRPIYQVVDELMPLEEREFVQNNNGYGAASN